MDDNHGVVNVVVAMADDDAAVVMAVHRVGHNHDGRISHQRRGDHGEQPEKHCDGELLHGKTSLREHRKTTP
jgi:hypothetical protein